MGKDQPRMLECLYSSLYQSKKGTGCKRCKISNKIKKEGEQEINKRGGTNLCEEGGEIRKNNNNKIHSLFIREMRVVDTKIDIHEHT